MVSPPRWWARVGDYFARAAAAESGIVADRPVMSVPDPRKAPIGYRFHRPIPGEDVVWEPITDSTRAPFRREDPTMPEPTPTYDRVDPPTERLVTEAEQPEPDVQPAGTGSVPAADGRPDCAHCHGTGKQLSTSDLLRASLDLLGTDPRELDHFVGEFYRRLIAWRPYLATIFPADLADVSVGVDSRGKAQRDKLLGALVALGSTYDPDNPEAMRVLDTHLAAFGRAHSSFGFPDGVRPPSLQEYSDVKLVLLDVFRETAGPRWWPEFDQAWSQAYDYAYRRMADAADEFLRERVGQVFPRSVRQ